MANSEITRLDIYAAAALAAYIARLGPECVESDNLPPVQEFASAAWEMALAMEEQRPDIRMEEPPAQSQELGT